MTNVLLYTRVAHAKQDKTTSEVDNQQESLLRFSELNGYNVLGIFRDECSGNKFDRPEWNRLNELIETNKGSVNIILCTTWSRISRNIEMAFVEIERLKSIGVEINTSEQPLDITNADSNLLLSIYLCTGASKLRK